MKKIGFIGFGRMGSALAEAAVGARFLPAKQIVVFDPDPAVRKRIVEAGFCAADSLSDVVANSKLVFLCVKPQVMGSLLKLLQSALVSLQGKKPVFVSIAAGIPIKKLQQGLGTDVSVLRVMPNTPALVHAGMSVVSRGRKASAGDEAFVKKILSAVGAVMSLKERHLNAVTAVSGSGPAYVFYLAEGLIEGAVRLGLDSKTARALVHQTVFGAGKMLRTRPEPADELRRQVTSPGGTTAAAVAEFDGRGLKSILISAVAKACQRSKDLAKS